MKKMTPFIKKIVVLFAFVLFLLSPANAYTSPSPEAVEAYNAGLQYVENSDYQNAVISFQKAIEYDPGFIDAYYNIGGLYEYAGDFETALRAYFEVVALDPKDYDTIFRMADLYQKVGMLDEALEYIEILPSTCNVYSEAQKLKKEVIAAKDEKIKQQAQAQQKQQIQQEQVRQAQTQQQYQQQPTQYQQERPAPPPGRTAAGGYTDSDKKLLNKYSAPTGLAVDRSGNVYIASFSDNAIYVVTPDERNKKFADSPMLDGPIDVATDYYGNLFVANFNKDNILKITPTGNVSIFKENVASPYSVLVKDDVLFVAEQGTNSVIKFNLN